MNIFQYPNQQEVLKRNTVKNEMNENVGSKIKFTIYDKRGFPIVEKSGVIISVSGLDYVVQCGAKKFLVPENDYISIINQTI